MKKLLCVLLSLVLLLSFAGCAKESAEEPVEKLIEEVLLCYAKVPLGIATQEEYEKPYSEKYLQHWVDSGHTAGYVPPSSGIVDDSYNLNHLEPHQQLTEVYGENYKVSVEIISVEDFDLQTTYKNFEKDYPHLKLDDVEDVRYVIWSSVISGNKKTEVRINSMWQIVLKINGRWCVR